MFKFRVKQVTFHATKISEHYMLSAVIPGLKNSYTPRNILIIFLHFTQEIGRVRFTNESSNKLDSFNPRSCYNSNLMNFLTARKRYPFCHVEIIWQAEIVGRNEHSRLGERLGPLSLCPRKDGASGVLSTRVTSEKFCHVEM